MKAAVENAIKLLTWLSDQEQAVAPYYRDDQQNIYVAVASVFRRLKSRELEEASGERKFSSLDAHGFVFLQATERERKLLPVLGFAFDLDEQRIQFWLGLFLLEGDSSPEKPLGVGYRYETPEAGRGSEHGYFHIQPMRAMDHLAPTPKYLMGWWDSTSWMSTTFPAFPLDAGDATAMLLALLISVYGLQETKRLLNECGMRETMTLSIDTMRCLAPAKSPATSQRRRWRT
jgi:hypothetical protein